MIREANLKLLLLFTVISFNYLSYGQAKIDTVTIKTKIYCDHCQTCETCGIQFERDLYLSKGVKSSTYNPADTTITVVYRTNKTNVEIIRKTVAKLGFDADHVPADPKGYVRLDNCCKLPQKEGSPR